MARLVIWNPLDGTQRCVVFSEEFLVSVVETHGGACATLVRSERYDGSLAEPAASPRLMSNTCAWLHPVLDRCPNGRGITYPFVHIHAEDIEVVRRGNRFGVRRSSSERVSAMSAHRGRR